MSTYLEQLDLFWLSYIIIYNVYYIVMIRIHCCSKLNRVVNWIRYWFFNQYVTVYYLISTLVILETPTQNIIFISIIISLNICVNDNIIKYKCWGRQMTKMYNKYH